MKTKNVVFALLTLLIVQTSFAKKEAASVTPGVNEKAMNVGGAEMYPSKDIVDNLVNSKDNSTLVTAVKAAGLVETLKGPGPFTVFAPTNEAFAKLPKGTLETLLKPENKPALSKILTYHVVAGTMTAGDIVSAIKTGKGKASLKTVAGGMLTAKMSGNNVTITDEKGTTSTVKVADVVQKNGLIHSVDTVVQPK